MSTLRIVIFWTSWEGGTSQVNRCLGIICHSKREKMLCRCARLVIRKGAGFAGTSTGSRTTPRLRPPVPCSSIMTSDSNVRERQAIFSMSSSYGRFVHRAHMSALAEESGVEGREDGPPTVPLMPMHLRSLSEQGSAGARRCRKGTRAEKVPCFL